MSSNLRQLAFPHLALLDSKFWLTVIRFICSTFYSQSGGEHKDQAMRITNSLVNIRAITAHFQPRIDSWLAKEQLSTPTEDQILDVVRENYDSLTLKLQEGLDQYDNYAENPAYTSFFTSLVRSIVSDTRQVPSWVTSYNSD